MTRTTLVLIISSVLLTILLTLKIKTYLQKKKIRHRFAKAEKKEIAAKVFLKKHGYEIISAQKEFSYNIKVNGSPSPVSLRFDYQVKKRGKLYIAEVKSGKSAISIKNPATRRQLLEYCYATKSKGILLIDMENNSINKITFNNIKIQTLPVFIAGLTTGVVICITIISLLK